MKRTRVILISVAAALVIFIALGLCSGLKVRRYTIASRKLTDSVRIAHVSDLHSCKYGDGQMQLIGALRAQSPDIVVLTGDIFDDELPDENTQIFLSAVSSEYPCYYVTGNHEYWAGAEAFARKMEILESCGVTRLSGRKTEVKIRGQIINICGADDPDSYRLADVYGLQSLPEQLKAMEADIEDGRFSVLLSHRPEYAALYAQHGFDLVLSGHAHGGQWRIPGILNGLFAPDQGFFPRYSGGLYDLGSVNMIVSRGLARETTRIPRFYNPPELVIVDLMPE